MKRRRLLAGGLGLGLALTPLVHARARSRPYRIFMILFRGETAVEKGFRDYLAAHGIEAELLVHDVDQDVRRVPALIDEARRAQADLIYTWGTPVTVALLGTQEQRDPARHVTDIPVVFTMVASPEAAGLVHTRTAHGRNFTGAVHVVPLAQQLGAMRAYRPLKRLAMIYNPVELNTRVTLQALQQSAQRDGFELLARPVPLDAQGKPSIAALPQLVASVARQQPSLLYFGPDSFLGANRKLFTESAVAAGLPVFSATELPLRDGRALFGLVSPYEQVGRLTAHKAVQILRDNIAPQEVAIETLGRFSYIVNMAVAAELSLYPPLKVVNYAEIIR